MIVRLAAMGADLSKRKKRSIRFFPRLPLRPPRAGSRIQRMPTRSIPLLTDEQLIELLKKGDRKAGDALVQRHNRLVARAVYEVVRDLAAVEDLIQEIFMKAFRKVNLYNPEQGKFTVWLTTVARHE